MLVYNMEIILTNEIMENIFSYLNKDDLFSFLSINSNITAFSYYLFNRFKMDYQIVKNMDRQYQEHIKYLFNLSESEIEMNAHFYPNIRGFYQVKYDPQINLIIQYRQCIKSLITEDFRIDKDLTIYTSLNKLAIHNLFFNEPIDQVPESLQVLKIKGSSFNSIISEKILKQLHKLIIISATFNQEYKYKPPKYITKSYMFGTFFKLNEHHKKLPVLSDEMTLDIC